MRELDGGVALADEPTKDIAINASSPSARQPVQRPSGATLPGNHWRWGVFSRISTGCQRATASSQAQNLSRPLTASATPPAEGLPPIVYPPHLVVRNASRV